MKNGHYKLMSKGEEKVAEILKSHGVQFIREYTDKSLKYYGNPLRIDFAIVKDFSLSPQIFIEFSGEQHYYYVGKFYKCSSDFKKAKERDRVKIKWCLQNGYKLIIIPYWELENLTYEKIFNTPAWVAKSKWHYDKSVPPKK